MTKEILFNKYKTHGAGYHWVQNSLHPIKMNSFIKARYQKCIQLLNSELGSFAGKKIVDLGCGDGVLTYDMFKNGADSYGVDLDSDALEFAKKKHQSLGSTATFFQESCTQTHFEDESFDAIVSSDVIEHLSEPENLLTEIYRILKPNGIAVVSTPIRFTEHPLDKMHTIEWFKDEFISFVEKTFSHVEFQYSHPIFWYELMIKSVKHRVGVNILSYFKNPFLYGGTWRLQSMQYAIIKKVCD